VAAEATIRAMTTQTARIEESARELETAARAAREAAGQPGCSAAAVPLLASLEHALRLLSAGWYQLAADAAPGVAARRSGRVDGNEDSEGTPASGLSHEEETNLVATLHGVAAALASSARACRVGGRVVEPLIARSRAEPVDAEAPKGSRCPTAPSTLVSAH
jgi:hypothetical protein